METKTSLSLSGLTSHCWKRDGFVCLKVYVCINLIYLKMYPLAFLFLMSSHSSAILASFEVTTSRHQSIVYRGISLKRWQCLHLVSPGQESWMKTMWYNRADSPVRPWGKEAPSLSSSMPPCPGTTLYCISIWNTLTRTLGLVVFMNSSLWALRPVLMLLPFCFLAKESLDLQQQLLFTMLNVFSKADIRF